MKNDAQKWENTGDFWDISALVPPRKASYQAPPGREIISTEIAVPDVSTSTNAFPKLGDIEILTVDAPQNSREAARPMTEKPQAAQPTVTRVCETNAVMVGDVPLPKQYVSAAYEKEEQERPLPEASYVPEGMLLRGVRIYPHKNEYSYYAELCRHARKLFSLEGKECEAVPFFSYMPQYSQLNRAQLRWYLWWRTSFRCGRVLAVDYSYLLLYLYEIINLGDAISPSVGQESMLRLWLSYRERYPRLDAIVREWLCDYSLLYRLLPPRLPDPLLGELLSGCRLKEFYVSATVGNAMCDAVLYFCSNYDYKKSKFYRGDAIPHFDRVMRGAVQETLQYLEEQREGSAPPTGGYSTVSRDAFSGAICAYPYKKRIEVDFVSFSNTYELRYIVTDVLKYTENALRAVLGIKSRLTVYRVSTELSARIDRYLATALPQKVQPRKKAPQTPTYEQRYELPKCALSVERAAKIEAASWQTTKRLIEAFEGGESYEHGGTVPQNPIPLQGVSMSEREVQAPTPVLAFAATAPMAESNGQKSLFDMLGELREFVRQADRGDALAQRAFAAQMNSMPDAIADKINTVAGDSIGDIILEDRGGFYAVIEDYRELLQEEGILP
ncbi:MAG: TerB N-terminal domain-containing protein [Clostridia bacterium]|nr:TerB N-terminal domain-containing protein [Clostridia bacterium]